MDLWRLTAIWHCWYVSVRTAMTGTDMHLGIYTYDGSALADSEDVVVVTVNYRTNGQR